MAATYTEVCSAVKVNGNKTCEGMLCFISCQQCYLFLRIDLMPEPTFLLTAIPVTRSLSTMFIATSEMIGRRPPIG